MYKNYWSSKGVKAFIIYAMNSININTYLFDKT